MNIKIPLTRPFGWLFNIPHERHPREGVLLRMIAKIVMVY